MGTLSKETQTLQKTIPLQKTVIWLCRLTHKGNRSLLKCHRYIKCYNFENPPLKIMVEYANSSYEQNSMGTLSKKTQ